MSERDMEMLARKLLTLERQQNAASRATQLPQSSVRASDGSDYDIAHSVEDSVGIREDVTILNEYTDGISDYVDEVIDYSIEIPTWVQEAAESGDESWESAQYALESVENAQAAADDAAADALAASQAAAEAEARVANLQDSSLELVPSTGFREVSSGPDFSWWNQSGGGRVGDTYPGGVPSLIFGLDDEYQLISDSGEWRTWLVQSGDYFRIPAGNTVEFNVTYLSGSAAEVFVDIRIGNNVVQTAELTPSTSSTTHSFRYSNTSSSTSSAVGIGIRGNSPTPAPDSESLIVVSKVSVRDVTALVAAEEAAEAAQYLAEGIYTTIPSTTEPTTRANGSPLVQGDLWYKVGVDENADKFIGVGVWDGTQWQDRQLVADSVLVPGSVGPVLIEDGAITGQKVAADAIDGMTITGAEIIGGTVTQVGKSVEEGLHTLPSTPTDFAGWSGITTHTTDLPAGIESTASLGTHFVGAPTYGSAMSWTPDRRFFGTTIVLSALVRVNQALTLEVEDDEVSIPANTWQRIYWPETTVDRHYSAANFGVLASAGSDPELRITETQVEVVHSPTLRASLELLDGVPGLRFTADGVVFSEYLGNRPFLNKFDLDQWVSASDGTHAWVSEEQREYVRVGEVWKPGADVARGGGLVPPGVVVPFAGQDAPEEYLMCDGSPVDRTDYADLFDVIGTTYGHGNGSTTFNVPDMRSRVPVGESSDAEFNALGKKGGAKTHTLTTSQMPSHTHGPGGSANRFQITDRVSAPGKRVAGAANATGIWTPGFNASDESFQSAATTASRGSGSAHNNLQPYITMNYIIKT